MTNLPNLTLVHMRCPLHVNYILHELLAAFIISLSAILDHGRLSNELKTGTSALTGKPELHKGIYKHPYYLL